PVQCWDALLHRLAMARAVDRLRKRRRRLAREEAISWDQVCSREPPTTQAAEEQELVQQLHQALAQLPPQQAEVFCLHCLEEWSYQEIAQQFALSTSTVGVLLHRARKRLQELLLRAAARDA